MLGEYARKVAASLRPGTCTWFYGYGNLFLAEYVLATGDKSILPELTRTAKEATMGQSAVGTWGHEFYITPSRNLNGYGCMNQPGIVLTLSLVLARQAGENGPAVDRAIERSAKFLRYYVNKGGIPYGDHRAWPGHEDNGKCSSTAVLFDQLGDREAAAFFAKMAAAAYAERERGHTGNFFNILWAMLGVSRCSPLATGAYLLACALPIKSLYLTGKKPGVVPSLNGKEVEEVLPQLRKKRLAENAEGAKIIDKFIADIEASTNASTLVNLKDFIAHASAGWSPAKGSPARLAERRAGLSEESTNARLGGDRSE